MVSVLPPTLRQQDREVFPDEVNAELEVVMEQNVADRQSWFKHNYQRLLGYGAVATALVGAVVAAADKNDDALPQQPDGKSTNGAAVSTDTGLPDNNGVMFVGLKEGDTDEDTDEEPVRVAARPTIDTSNWEVIGNIKDAPEPAKPPRRTIDTSNWIKAGNVHDVPEPKKPTMETRGWRVAGSLAPEAKKPTMETRGWRVAGNISGIPDEIDGIPDKFKLDPELAVLVDKTLSAYSDREVTDGLKAAFEKYLDATLAGEEEWKKFLGDLVEDKRSYPAELLFARVMRGKQLAKYPKGIDGNGKTTKEYEGTIIGLVDEDGNAHYILSHFANQLNERAKAAQDNPLGIGSSYSTTITSPDSQEEALDLIVKRY